jgi:hypothetical protein
MSEQSRSPASGRRRRDVGGTAPDSAKDQGMALYEVQLLDGVHEVRYTDVALELGATVKIANRTWRVEREVSPRTAGAAARYLCVELRTSGASAAPSRSGRATA